MSQVRSRLTRVFQYLRELKGHDKAIVRDIKKYEKVWWQSDLEHIRGITLSYHNEQDGEWISIQRPFVPVPPTLPEELTDWVLDYSDPDKIPEAIPQIGDKKFEDDQHLVDLFKEWLGDVWKPWADDAKIHWRTKYIYDELFNYYHQLLEEGEEKEIAWGHGLLTWKVGNLEIQRHLLVTPLEIDFDPDSGVFRLRPKSTGTQIETDMLTNVEYSNAKKLMETIEELNNDINIRIEKEVGPFLQKVIHLISPDGQYYSTDEPYLDLWESPRISYTPALFIRKSNKQSWIKELDHVICQLDHGISLPSHLVRLVSTDEEEIAKEAEATEDWSDEVQDVLYPLPSNSAQREVLKYLAKSDGVVVQGAPGTGKSHTIVNVAAHLLAQGKRVLVTSEKERSLEVIAEMIPEEIRPFCVKLFSNDPQAAKELEYAIRIITEGLEGKDIDQLTVQANQLQKERSQVIAELERIEKKLESSALLEHEAMDFSGHSFTAVSGRKWLQDHEKSNWFPDQVKTKEPFPISKEERKEFIKLLHRFGSSDHADLLLHRPNLSDIPTPNSFHSLVQELHEIENQFTQSEHIINEWNITENIKHLIPSAIESVEQAIQELRLMNDSYEWQLSILKDESLQERWKDLVEDFREKIKELQALEVELLEYEFQVPNNKPIPLLKDDVKIILDRLENEKQVGSFFKHVTGRHQAYLFKECIVNQKAPSTLNDFKLLSKHLERLDLRRRIALKWNRLMAPIAGPTIEEDHEQLAMLLDELIQQVEYLLNWNEQIIEPLLPIVQSLGIPVVDWFNVEWHEELHMGLKAIELSSHRESLQQAFSQLHQKLQSGKYAPDAHPIWMELFEACQVGDTERWESLYQNLQDMEKAEPLYRKYKDYVNRLEEVAPIWLASLQEQVLRGESIEVPDDLDEAWLYSQLSYYLNQVPSSSKVLELEEKYHQLKKQEEVLVRKYISVIAWIKLLERTTETEKRSLVTWLQLIKRMQTFAGKQVEQYHEEAKQILKASKSAVPIWIMPVEKVIENFYLDSQPFDLIIVDESSQSNLFALSLMLRSRKFMVVGDDNQILPDFDATEYNINRELVSRYLYDIPQGNQLDMSTSLYDVAYRVFREKAILKENFRSVPPIIAFNSELMYGNDIVAIRPLEQSKLLGGPLQNIYVTNEAGEHQGVNKAEAEAVVKRIESMLSDPNYHGKTIGVISLEGIEQGRYIDNLIKQKFTEKQILERRLVTGDAYRFQGDERDVILLSMVCAEKAPKALNGEADRRYYNIATSRAREQLIVVHSVTIEQLPKDCVRRTLLEHCQNEVEFEMGGKEKLESSFEQEVYDWLKEKGYKVSTKVPVGWEIEPIDLLVHGKYTSLAIQIEGNTTWNGLKAWRNDLKQQRVLERIGWKFYRLFASRFTQNKVESFVALDEYLKSLGIEPEITPVAESN